MAQLVKNPPAMRETWVWSPGWEDPLEKGKATHSSILPGEFHGLYSSWGCKESDTTEWLSLSQTIKIQVQRAKIFPQQKKLILSYCGSGWEKSVFPLQKIRRQRFLFIQSRFPHFGADTPIFVSDASSLPEKVLFYISKSWSESKLVVLKSLQIYWNN